MKKYTLLAALLALTAVAACQKNEKTVVVPAAAPAPVVQPTAPAAPDAAATTPAAPGTAPAMPAPAVPEKK